MNLDEQKSEWQRRNQTLSIEYFDTDDVVEKTMEFENRLARRDFCQAASALIVVVFFGYALLGPEPLPFPMLSRIGIILMMLGVTSSVGIVYWTRLSDDKPAADSPTLDFCRTEIRRVDRQIRLLRHTTLWYSGPMLMGAMLMIAGLLIFTLWALAPVKFFLFLVAFALCFVAAGFVIHRGNEREIRSKLKPFREGLVELAASLENENETARET